jgi:hypothetical protein
VKFDGSTISENSIKITLVIYSRKQNKLARFRRLYNAAVKLAEAIKPAAIAEW